MKTPSSNDISVAEWASIRSKRDRLISSTDWTQMTDTPLTAEQKSTFATYRQALRDLPQSTGDPDKIVWPEMPTI